MSGNLQQLNGHTRKGVEVPGVVPALQGSGQVTSELFLILRAHALRVHCSRSDVVEIGEEEVSLSPW